MKKTAITIAAIAVLIPLFIALALAGTGLSIGAANAWLLDGAFSEGWSAVWSKPWIALGWFALFGFKGVSRSK